MKRMRLIGCMLAAVVGPGAACAHEHEDEWEISHVISLLDLGEVSVQEFSQGRMGAYILKCPAGTSLPLEMTLKGQFLGLESAAAAPLYLKVLKTCYIRCEEPEEFLFSTDLQTWKRFSEFFTGELKVSVGAENGKPVASLQLEINQRKT